ncbi:MAG: caspase family protein, partial [Trichodesmium sp. MO_231.B1]|nr:caspase family protein [Trichodesmium sp. MO_231.B1]
MSDFSRRLAVVIGINQYTNGIATLRNPLNDADQIHHVLQQQHNYETHLLKDTDATKEQITKLLTKTLPKQVKEDECLLFYFAGHGIALDGDDGPQGYLIPQDAVAGNSSTYLPMNQVHDWLTALPCRHFLTILDCCFAGAFRWSSTRDFATAPEEIYQEHYHRFIEHPAWQVITSASYDETALDALSSLQKDTRSTNGNHSPFAAAL